MGRSLEGIAARPFQAEKMTKDDWKTASTRYLLVQAITNQFWTVMIETYFPTLLVHNKLYMDYRNVTAGDICLLNDPFTYKGE